MNSRNKLRAICRSHATVISSDLARQYRHLPRRLIPAIAVRETFEKRVPVGLDIREDADQELGDVIDRGAFAVRDGPLAVNRVIRSSEIPISLHPTHRPASAVCCVKMCDCGHKCP